MPLEESCCPNSSEPLEQTIEEKLKAIKPYNNCRSCKHFIRVNFETAQNVMHRQGFCLLGALAGDYGLYYSRSVTDCMGFVFDETHYKIALAETTLEENKKAFCNSIKDRRSKNYKLIEPLMEATTKYIEEVRSKHAGYASMLAMRDVEVTAHKYYRDNHADEYVEVYKMVTLRKADYTKFLAKIAVQIHDEFCKCDHIEFKPEGDAK
ncbi:MAG: hypothetical protein PHT77_05520 [Bacteroidales bacterium]|nr:hypothetical protein [Bacteroidales bacterium]